MKVNEIFCSIQGEGPQTGMSAWFIRTTGCNLSCSWCDTKYALKDGKNMTHEEILNTISTNDCKNIVITGGEPLLQPDLLSFLKKAGGYKIYIETNGTLYYQYLIGYATFIVSPKLQFMNVKYLSALKKWAVQGTFKFVIGSKDDFDNALKLCERVEKNDNIYFMPQGTTDTQIKDTMLNMVDWIKFKAPHVRISPRLQVYMWGSKRCC